MLLNYLQIPLVQHPCYFYIKETAGIHRQKHYYTGKLPYTKDASLWIINIKAARHHGHWLQPILYLAHISPGSPLRNLCTFQGGLEIWVLKASLDLLK